MKPYPTTNEFSGANTPTHLECDINDIVIEGEIPKEIDGSWFRLTPDPLHAPRFEEDNFFSGDGSLSRFKIKNGKVDFKVRYVLTDRLKAEKAAGKALFGVYHNPYTDDASVKDVNRGVANTTPVWHAGKLLAIKEDTIAMEVDPHSLGTKGWFDYHGKLRSKTMTAHPRIDFDTGEMFINGYEASGPATDDIAFGIVNKEGELVKEEWFKAPYVSMMHDFVVTKEHIIFPLFPTTTNLERIKSGGAAWIYEPEKPTYVGIMPREGSVKDLRWFKGKGVSGYHFMNAYTEGNKVYADLSYTEAHQFPFVRTPSGHGFEPEKMRNPYVRWEFDLSKPGESWQEYVLCDAVGDFPRVADKDHMKDYEVGYYVSYLPENGAPEMICIGHMGFNTLTRIEVKSGKAQHYSFGPGTTMAEPVHVASKQKDHEGYLMTAVHLHNEWLSDVAIFEAGSIEKGPIAKIKLPIRMRHQLHGNWVDAEKLL